MYNLRYHIASLVSVFLALAIGVLLGGLIVDNSSAFDTGKMIQNLQSQYDELRASNDALTAQDSALEGLSAELVAAHNAGRLASSVVAVLASDDAVSEHAVTALAQAGATVLTVKVDAGSLAPTGTDSALRAALVARGIDPAVADDAALATLVAGEWRSADATATPITDALVSDGVLTISGLPTGAKRMPVVTGVVDLATAGNKADTFSLELAVALDGAGATGVGASVIGGSGVVATEAWARGISGVATLGSSLGSHTLVSVLAGAQRGLFGLVDGATAPYAAL